MPAYVKDTNRISLETPFAKNIGTAFNNSVLSIATQSDGKIVIGGSFTTFNGATVNYIVRLNSDGTRDTAFTTNTGTGFNNIVRSIAIQSDGKIVIGGSFTSFNGATVNRIARLNSDGTRDATFTATGFDNSVEAIVIQSNGKLVIGGFFEFSDVRVNRIVRLNSDGTRDTSFTTNTGTAFNSGVRTIAIQSDGKLVIGGQFTTFNGVTVNRIVLLNSDGTRDTAFTTNTGTAFNNIVFSIAIQSDGKIVIGGSFTTFNGATVNYIVRLNSDGTRDTSFTTNTGTAFNFTVLSIAIQSDGKLVIGGSFIIFNGATVNYIVRLNSDGTRDTSFTTNTGTAFNNGVQSIAIQSDGKILVGGLFTTFNGATVNRIVLLTNWAKTAPWGKVSGTWAKAKEAYANVAGTWKQWWLDGGVNDTGFTIGTGFSTGVNSIAIQSDGKLVIGGGFTTFNGATVNRIARLNTDGTRDTAFTTNTGTAFNDFVRSIAIQSDGKLVIGGAFWSFNGVTVNSIVRLNSDGTRDTAFTTNTGNAFNNWAYSIAIQSDGKLVIGGFFTFFNGVAANRIVRLNSDGTRDATFTTNTGTAFNEFVRSIAIQSDGKIVVEGSFTTFNGATVNGIVRLNSDGTRDTAFTTNTGTAFPFVEES